MGFMLYSVVEMMMALYSREASDNCSMLITLANTGPSGVRLPKGARTDCAF